MNELCKISTLLLDWYDRCARSMPWRGIHDAYKTWVSETMLQQTRVETVIPYFNRFMDRFPSLPSLASAEEAEVLKLWQGLGYYSRARNLSKGARQVLDLYGGVLPGDPVLLRKICGIGPYTAGAIASIAYDVPVPAVDGNVLRVFSRLFGVRENIRQPEIRKKLESMAASAVPQLRPGDYNQAVMDLGATVCVPGTPDCSRCPLSSVCDAFSRGDAANLPVIPQSKPQRIYRFSVPVLLSGGRTLLRCRTESLLKGLWCFPLLDCDPADLRETIRKKFRFDAVPSGEPREVRHVFTHLIWDLSVQSFHADPGLPDSGEYRWIPLQDLDQLAFPAAMNVPLQEAKNIYAFSINAL